MTLGRHAVRLAAITALSVPALPAQTLQSAPPQSTQSPAPLAFEVATIKDPNPAAGLMGFYSYPGGRVHCGNLSVRDLIHLAYDVPNILIHGGPDWVSTRRFDILALTPEAQRAAKAPAVTGIPTPAQREMIRTLLQTRFHLVARVATKEVSGFALVRGKHELTLQPPHDPASAPRGTVVIKAGGIADGEAFGSNISMPFFASQLAARLQRPVIDQTGLPGSFDFHLAPTDPENHDIEVAIFGAVRRLGLDLKPTRAPAQTVTIDSVELPTEN